ncbi:unnamed protein product [Closterium sp. NIES-53]
MGGKPRGGKGATGGGESASAAAAAAHGGSGGEKARMADGAGQKGRGGGGAGEKGRGREGSGVMGRTAEAAEAAEVAVSLGVTGHAGHLEIIAVDRHRFPLHPRLAPPPFLLVRASNFRSPFRSPSAPWHATFPHLLMPSCPHALMASCPHGLMPSCPHALMASWPHALMPSWPHARMTSWPHALMASWPHGLMPSCPRGLMPSWPLALMPTCPHGLMPSCPHGLMASCPHALMPSWPRSLLKQEQPTNQPIPPPPSFHVRLNPSLPTSFPTLQPKPPFPEPLDVRDLPELCPLAVWDDVERQLASEPQEDAMWKYDWMPCGALSAVIPGGLGSVLQPAWHPPWVEEWGDGPWGEVEGEGKGIQEGEGEGGEEEGVVSRPEQVDEVRCCRPAAHMICVLAPPSRCPLGGLGALVPIVTSFFLPPSSSSCHSSSGASLPRRSPLHPLLPPPSPFRPPTTPQLFFPPGTYLDLTRPPPSSLELVRGTTAGAAHPLALSSHLAPHAATAAAGDGAGGLQHGEGQASGGRGESEEALAALFAYLEGGAEGGGGGVGGGGGAGEARGVGDASLLLSVPPGFTEGGRFEAREEVRVMGGPLFEALNFFVSLLLSVPPGFTEGGRFDVREERDMLPLSLLRALATPQKEVSEVLSKEVQGAGSGGAAGSGAAGADGVEEGGERGREVGVEGGDEEDDGGGEGESGKLGFADVFQTAWGAGGDDEEEDEEEEEEEGEEEEGEEEREGEEGKEDVGGGLGLVEMVTSAAHRQLINLTPLLPSLFPSSPPSPLRPSAPPSHSHLTALTPRRSQWEEGRGGRAAAVDALHCWGRSCPVSRDKIFVLRRLRTNILSRGPVSHCHIAPPSLHPYPSQPPSPSPALQPQPSPLLTATARPSAQGKRSERKSGAAAAVDALLGAGRGAFGSLEWWTAGSGLGLLGAAPSASRPAASKEVSVSERN